MEQANAIAAEKQRQTESMLAYAETRSSFWSAKAEDLEKEVERWNRIMQTLVSVDRHGSLKAPEVPWQAWLEEGFGEPISDLPAGLHVQPPVAFNQALLEVTQKMGKIQENLKGCQKHQATYSSKAGKRKLNMERKESRDLQKIEDFKEDGGAAKMEKLKTLDFEQFWCYIKWVSMLTGLSSENHLLCF